MKKRSIAKYIITGTAALTFVMTIIMLIFVNILANAAIEYDVKSDMTKEARKNGRYLVFENGEIKATKEFVYEDDDVHFLVLSDRGEVLVGKYPNGIEIDIHPRNGEIHMVEVKGEEYYVFDRTTIEMTKETGENILIRSIVKKSDISSKYQTIKYLSYLSIPFMILCVVISGLVMARRISIPIKRICRTAESIGRDENLSQRIEYDGQFYEIEVLSQANNRMLERLENMFESQKQFTSDVAHELRTPIAVMIAQCEYAKEHLTTKQDFDEAIDVIYRQVKKTNDIIIQLLNLTRLDQDRVMLEFEYVSLGEIIRSVCEDEQIKSTKGNHFELDIAEVSAYVDISLMTILIQNLIHNAVKYSPQKAIIEVKLEKRDEDIACSVRDYGCGICKKDVQHIFDRFFRAEQSRNSEGYGLGLPLAQKIAEIHGGKITVTSEIGQGSTFTLILPQQKESF